ncbi:MAG: hypothetical protein FJ297_09455 [Planctomycetes bacterium]|nr:hypothetical protein [Planctomycetota bacterium]
MVRYAKWAVVLTLVLGLAGSLAAQEKKNKKSKGNAAAQNPVIKQLTEQLKALELSEEQQAKVKELVAGTNEKLAAIAKDRLELVGEEGLKKMNAARKEATDAGKKGKEVQDAVNASAGLSDEQIAKLKDIQAKQQTIVAELKKSVGGLLTEEQREKAGLNAPAKGKNKKKV